MKHVKLFEKWDDSEYFCEVCGEPVDLKILSPEQKKVYAEEGICPRCEEMTRDYDPSQEPPYGDILKKKLESLDQSALDEITSIAWSSSDHEITPKGYLSYMADVFNWEHKYGVDVSDLLSTLNKYGELGDSSDLSWTFKYGKPAKALSSAYKHFKPVIDFHLPTIRLAGDKNTSLKNDLIKLEKSIKGRSKFMTDQESKEMWRDILPLMQFLKQSEEMRDKLKKEIEDQGDLKNLSLSELDDLIDQALDQKNFDLVAKISKIKSIKYPGK